MNRETEVIDQQLYAVVFSLPPLQATAAMPLSNFLEKVAELKKLAEACIPKNSEVEIMVDCKQLKMFVAVMADQVQPSLPIDRATATASARNANLDAAEATASVIRGIAKTALALGNKAAQDASENRLTCIDLDAIADSSPDAAVSRKALKSAGGPKQQIDFLDGPAFIGGGQGVGSKVVHARSFELSGCTIMSYPSSSSARVTVKAAPSEFAAQYRARDGNYTVRFPTGMTEQLVRQAFASYSLLTLTIRIVENIYPPGYELLVEKISAPEKILLNAADRIADLTDRLKESA